MSVADWPALVITVGWAVTAFLVVWVITRRRSGARPSSDGREPRRERSRGQDEKQT